MIAREPGKSVLRFEQFELDLESSEVRRNGARIHLQGQPFKILVLLARHSGHLVTRDHIRQQIWGDETFVDFEQGLNFCIKQIRSALGDDVHHPHYLETLPRRGYRFIVPVEDVSARVVDEPPAQSRIAAVETPTQPSVPATRSNLWRVVVPALFALAGAGLALFVFWKPGVDLPGKPAGGKVMLAVLPFENLSGDSEQDYLSEGMTEEMITQLGSINPEQLGVIARTSAMKYKESVEVIEEVGRGLGVHYVLKGSVRLSTGRVRITARLIQVRDHTHLWAETYDRELGDLLSLQEEVARAIAHEIRVQITHHEGASMAPRISANREVYPLYLKGRHFWNKRSPEAMARSIEYFRQAIALDPKYAPAYAGLADAYTVLGFHSFMPASEAYPKAKEAAAQALVLDDKLADAHTALAGILLDYDWDWAGCEREFRRAIELDPNSPMARAWCASCLVPAGRLEEAIEQGRRALELDPLSPLINTSLGSHLHYAGRHKEAVEQHRKAIELDPNFAVAHLNLGRALEAQGDFAAALTEFRTAYRLSSGSPDSAGALGHALARSKRATEARKLLAELQAKAAKHFIPAYNIALIQAGLGDSEQALIWLEKAYEERSGRLGTLKVDSRFENLRSEPRFRALLARLRL